MPQLKRPEEGPQEKPAQAPKKKNIKGPRAVGLLQLNSSGKGTLIPVAILIDGKFYDASVYKANPVPMALEGGTVYEVEKTGESQGLFTVSGALHNRNSNSATPWLGAGSYVLNGAEGTSKVHKAEDKPRGLDNNDDAPPRLTRGTDAESATGQSSGGGSDSTESSKKNTTEGGGANSQPGRSSSGDSPGTNGNATSGGSGHSGAKPANTSTAGQSADQNANAQAPNASGKQTSAQANQGSSSTPGSSPTTASSEQAAAAANSGDQDRQKGSQNYYRPTLRRGKPTESAPDDTPEELTRTSESLPHNATGGSAPQPAVQLVPAISDGGGPLPESYEFFWKEGDEDERRKQMLALAANEVTAYLTKLAKDTIPTKPVAAKPAGANRGASARKSATRVEPVFESVQFRAFDVWRNSQPVMVLTAEAQIQTATGASGGPAVYYVTIAARTDIYGDLRKLYSGITDKFHLDVTPQLQLIDAVDADGDGRGELLFRETTDAGSGYLIYRATGDTLWKMFDSLRED
jgi:hypothetical protein